MNVGISSTIGMNQWKNLKLYLVKVFQFTNKFMGLKLVNGIYKGKTRPLFSSDGETWYEDAERKIPADMSQYREDDAGAFLIFLIGFIVIGFFFISLFL